MRRFRAPAGRRSAGGFSMIEVLVTIVVLAGLVGKVRGPRAEGIPYIKA